jgi:nucleoside-diphosphate-sugar epimerase
MPESSRSSAGQRWPGHPIFCGAALAGRELTVYGDGTQTRDYVYVGDVVRAFLAAANADRPGIWNIGTGTETSVLDLVRIIGEIAGRRWNRGYARPALVSWRAASWT